MLEWSVFVLNVLNEPLTNVVKCTLIVKVVAD